MPLRAQGGAAPDPPGPAEAADRMTSAELQRDTYRRRGARRKWTGPPFAGLALPLVAADAPLGRQRSR